MAALAAPTLLASNARVGKILEDFEDVELEPKTPLANRARFAFDGTDPVGGSPGGNNNAGSGSGMGSVGGITIRNGTRTGPGEYSL
jgi:hypothetical protein